MSRQHADEPPLDDDAPREHDEDGVPSEAWRCRAQSKQKGVRCGHWREPGMRVCRYHGGLSTGAPIKHGRWSRKLGKYAHAYREAKDDADLLDLRRPVAALDALVQRHAERLEEADTPDFRRRALRHYNAAQAAQRNGDATLAAVELGKLGKLLREGAFEDRALMNLSTELDRLARRIEGAWNVKLAKRQSINARDLTAVLARLVDVMRQELPPKDAQRIMLRIDKEILLQPLAERASRSGVRTIPPTALASDHTEEP